MTDKEYLIRSTAYHEAGHAIADIMGARALYGESGIFHSVEIYPDAITKWLEGDRVDGKGGRAGFVRGSEFYRFSGLASDYYSHPYDLAEMQVILCLAGPYAEAYFVNPRKTQIRGTVFFLGKGVVGDFDDAERAHEVLCDLAGRYVGWGKLEARTCKLVIECWPAITAVAERLLVKNTLTSAEVYSLAEPHLPTKGEGGRWAALVPPPHPFLEIHRRNILSAIKKRAS